MLSDYLIVATLRSGLGFVTNATGVTVAHSANSITTFPAHGPQPVLARLLHVIRGLETISPNKPVWFSCRRRLFE